MKRMTRLVQGFTVLETERAVTTQRLARQDEHGFSVVELVISVLILLILSAIALPSLAETLRSYRLAGDARALASQLSLAKMRAAAEFSQSQLSFNFANGTYQLQVFDKGANAFVTEGGAVQYLSSGVTFGFGAITTPAGTQPAPITDTPQIVLNSRGIPVNGGTDAIYLSNNGRTCAVTVSASGQISAWRYTGAVWQRL